MSEKLTFENPEGKKLTFSKDTEEIEKVKKENRKKIFQSFGNELDLLFKIRSATEVEKLFFDLHTAFTYKDENIKMQFIQGNVDAVLFIDLSDHKSYIAEAYSFLTEAFQTCKEMKK
jgi:hypothetical protein